MRIWETEVFEGRFHLPDTPPTFGEWADQFLLKVGHPNYPKAILDDLGGKEPSLWIIGGQEFDDAEPVLLILPVRLEIVFVLLFQDRQILFPEFWFKTRDTQTIHRASVPLYSLLLFTGHYGATGAL